MTDRDVLVRLIKAGEAFRKTPIVDDDFPAYRNRFDYELAAAKIHTGKAAQGELPMGLSQDEQVQEKTRRLAEADELLERWLDWAERRVCHSRKEQASLLPLETPTSRFCELLVADYLSDGLQWFDLSKE